MEKGIHVKDITVSSPVSGFFIVHNPSERMTKKNTPFWTFLLSDTTGSIDAKVWDTGICEAIPVDGEIVHITDAKAESYKGFKQVSIAAMSKAKEGDYDSTWFALDSSKTLEKAEEKFDELMKFMENEVRNQEWKNFANAVFNDADIRSRFIACPGAVSVHHAYCGGLVEHTLGVCKICMCYCDLYPFLERDLLFMGALFHDIGKIREYAKQNKQDNRFEVTDEGRLLGHMGAAFLILSPFWHQIPTQNLLHFQHLILSHHGELAFGSCVVPQTQEALALHFADNFDAKMGICAKARDNLPNNATWSEPIFSLEKRRLFFPNINAQAPINQEKRDNIPHKIDENENRQNQSQYKSDSALCSDAFIPYADSNGNEFVRSDIPPDLENCPDDTDNLLQDSESLEQMAYLAEIETMERGETPICYQDQSDKAYPVADQNQRDFENQSLEKTKHNDTTATINERKEYPNEHPSTAENANRVTKAKKATRLKTNEGASESSAGKKNKSSKVTIQNSLFS